MFLHGINLDYPNLTCQLRPWTYGLGFAFETRGLGLGLALGIQLLFS